MRIDRSEIQDRLAEATGRSSEKVAFVFACPCVTSNPCDLGNLLDAINTVNENSFCGADPRTLVIAGFVKEPIIPYDADCILWFGYWQGGWSTYPPIDFDALFPESETWRNRPPLL